MVGKRVEPLVVSERQGLCQDWMCVISVDREAGLVPAGSEQEDVTSVTTHCTTPGYPPHSLATVDTGAGWSDVLLLLNTSPSSYQGMYRC